MAVGPMSFEGDLLLIIAILFGLVTVVMTFINSRKMKGEVFEKPFVYLSLGILFMTISLIDVTFFQGIFSELVVGLIHDICFIIGLALMLTASIQITKYLIGMGKIEEKIEKSNILEGKGS